MPCFFVFCILQKGIDLRFFLKYNKNKGRNVYEN